MARGGAQRALVGAGSGGFPATLCAWRRHPAEAPTPASPGPGLHPPPGHAPKGQGCRELSLSRKRGPAGRGFGPALPPAGRAPEGGRPACWRLLSQLSTFRPSSPGRPEKLLEEAPGSTSAGPGSQSPLCLSRFRRSLAGAGGPGYGSRGAWAGSAPCLVSRVSVWRAVCFIRAPGGVPSWPWRC